MLHNLPLDITENILFVAFMDLVNPHGLRSSDDSWKLQEDHVRTREKVHKAMQNRVLVAKELSRLCAASQIFRCIAQDERCLVRVAQKTPLLGTFLGALMRCPWCTVETQWSIISRMLDERPMELFSIGHGCHFDVRLECVVLNRAHMLKKLHGDKQRVFSFDHDSAIAPDSDIDLRHTPKLVRWAVIYGALDALDALNSFCCADIFGHPASMCLKYHEHCVVVLDPNNNNNDMHHQHHQLKLRYDPNVDPLLLFETLWRRDVSVHAKYPFAVEVQDLTCANAVLWNRDDLFFELVEKHGFFFGEHFLKALCGASDPQGQSKQEHHRQRQATEKVLAWVKQPPIFEMLWDNLNRVSDKTVNYYRWYLVGDIELFKLFCQKMIVTHHFVNYNLQKATQRGDKAFIEQIVQYMTRGHDAALMPGAFGGCIEVAATCNNREVLEWLIQKMKVEPQNADLLFIAIKQGDMDMINSLQQKLKHRWTKADLFVAACAGMTELVDCILQSCSSPEEKVDCHLAIAHEKVAHSGRVQVFQLLKDVHRVAFTPRYAKILAFQAACFGQLHCAHWLATHFFSPDSIAPQQWNLVIDGHYRQDDSNDFNEVERFLVAEHHRQHTIWPDIEFNDLYALDGMDVLFVAPTDGIKWMAQHMELSLACIRPINWHNMAYCKHKKAIVITNLHWLLKHEKCPTEKEKLLQEVKEHITHVPSFVFSC